MAIKKCSFCKAEYDEMYDVCPVCGMRENEADEELVSAGELDEAVADEIAEDDVLQEVSGYESEVLGNDESEEELIEEAKTVKIRKILTIVAVLLAVVVIALTAWMIYSRSAKDVDIPDTIDVEAFSADALVGTYTESNIGISYSFAKENVEINVPDVATDSAASSSGETAPAEKTETFDGTYVCIYAADLIDDLVAKAYIDYAQKGEDYEAYKSENKIKDEDYLGYINAKALKADMEQFDTSNYVTQSYEQYKENGYWRYEDDCVELFDAAGTSEIKFEVIKNGLIQADSLYKGTVKNKAFNGQLVYAPEAGEYVATIRTYDDGYFIHEVVMGDSTEMLAGTYVVSGDKLILDINGTKDTFRITDSGITPYLFAK